VQALPELTATSLMPIIIASPSTYETETLRLPGSRVGASAPFREPPSEPRPGVGGRRRLSADELERGYNARATVPDVDALLRDYRAQSTPMYALPCVRDIACGPHPDERLDLFPVPGRRDAPLFVFVHGGYWRALAKEDSVFMARCFTERGIAVASLNYTLSPQAPLAEIVAQCRRGLGWLHAHGAAHGIDTSHIVLAGRSAGGHLAAAMLSPAGVAAHGHPPGVGP